MLLGMDIVRSKPSARGTNFVDVISQTKPDIGVVASTSKSR
jgi:hypothetical protein